VTKPASLSTGDAGLSDAEALSALDDRGSSMLPALRPYVR